LIVAASSRIKLAIFTAIVLYFSERKGQQGRPGGWSRWRVIHRRARQRELHFRRQFCTANVFPPIGAEIMIHRHRAAAAAAAFVVAHTLWVNPMISRAVEGEYESASSGTYSASVQAQPSAQLQLTFKDRILATYDANGNGRLDGSERSAARAEISRYNAQKSKYVYAQQRYRHAVRTAQIAYTQAALRPRPVSFSLTPAMAARGGVDCEDPRYATVNFSSPAMRRASGPPPSSAPGLIHMPAAKVACCSPGESGY
jgi:hypothetical protein